MRVDASESNKAADQAISVAHTRSLLGKRASLQCARSTYEWNGEHYKVVSGAPKRAKTMSGNVAVAPLQ